MKVSLTLSLFFRLSDEGPSGHDNLYPEFPAEVIKSLATRGEFYFLWLTRCRLTLKINDFRPLWHSRRCGVNAQLGGESVEESWIQVNFMVMSYNAVWQQPIGM